LTATTKAKALVSGKLELVENLGEYALVHMLVGNDQMMTAKMDVPPEAKYGSLIHFTVDKEFLHLFDKASGIRVS
jgi:ABC-type sugar transport system ATPase subunit